MFVSIKKLFKWSSAKSVESKKNHTSLLLAASIGILEDVLFWKRMWLSLSCIFILNLIFFVCIHREVNLIKFIIGLCITMISFDGLETWLKHKHRTGCLKKLASQGSSELDYAVATVKNWLRRKWMEYVYLRESNHTKAFLLLNIILSVIFIIGKYLSSYILLYCLCMIILTLHKIAPPVMNFAKKIQQHAESDSELEELIPVVSDLDIKLLSIEPEQYIPDDKQSLDFWKPEDIPIEEASDSSDNSSSLVTNLSVAKLQKMQVEKDIETSDSSDDEYIPLVQQKDQLESTLEVQPTSTWSGMAYNALYNLTGAVTNMVYSTRDDTNRKRVPSIDSSDGFEMIDQNDL